MLSSDEAHLATGMKVSEILDIEKADGGYKVTTHDGQAIYLENADVPEVADPEPEPEKKSASTTRSGRGKA